MKESINIECPSCGHRTVMYLMEDSRPNEFRYLQSCPNCYVSLDLTVMESEK